MVSLSKDPLLDVGGGSVPNGEPRSLARIPLRWMIRECFKTGTGIIFDAHMLKHEVGLDIDSIHRAPKPLSLGNLYLARPDGAELKGFSLTHIPVAIISSLGSPFHWVRGKLSNFRKHDTPERKRPISEGEPHEELLDALSPIYDQLERYTLWKVIEWIPCKLPPLPNPSTSTAMSSYGA